MQSQNFSMVPGHLSGKKMDLQTIQDTLRGFNATIEDEGSTQGFTTGVNGQGESRKRKILNEALKAAGLSEIPAYSVMLACQKRQANLQGLLENEYPSAIIKTPSSCVSERPRLW